MLFCLSFRPRSKSHGEKVAISIALFLVGKAPAQKKKQGPNSYAQASNENDSRTPLPGNRWNGKVCLFIIISLLVYEFKPEFCAIIVLKTSPEPQSGFCLQSLDGISVPLALVLPPNEAYLNQFCSASYRSFMSLGQLKGKLEQRSENCVMDKTVQKKFTKT